METSGEIAARRGRVEDCNWVVVVVVVEKYFRSILLAVDGSCWNFPVYHGEGLTRDAGGSRRWLLLMTIRDDVKALTPPWVTQRTKHSNWRILFERMMKNDDIL